MVDIRARFRDIPWSNAALIETADLVASKAQSTEKSLVIVESPAKAKTIERYLGSGYTVKASMGHVRDLPANDMGIRIDESFEPVYEILPEKRKVVRELKKLADSASRVFLATDLDREGEAIAWHLVHALDLDESSTQRVIFNEITKSAIKSAFERPQRLDMDKVNAQQARRLLDRIVGYELSPLLQAKITRGLSAGRVQSVAVRLIVDREREIRAFVPEESWTIHGCFGIEIAKDAANRAAWEKFLSGGKDDKGRTVKERNAWLTKHHCLYAELVRLGDSEFNAKQHGDARKAAEALGYVFEALDESPFEPYESKGLKKCVLRGHVDPGKSPRYAIKDVQTKRTTTRPNAPFTTAALQQAASTQLGFAPSRTMRIAQQLYEGVDLGGGEGPIGLITYMRTDSTNLSKDSLSAIRDLVRRDFGDRYVPDSPNFYGSSKSAQEAHEAIRPSDVNRSPETLRKSLTAEQHKLYDLVWKRSVACQMAQAEWDSTTITISADTRLGEALFRTGGRRLVFDGFLRVMGLSDDGDVVLPEINAGAPLGLVDIEPKQQFTSPPARFTEAALVKKMESEGIGRPSTYAAVIQTIQDRGYSELVDRKLHPTALGEVVTDKLIEHFPEIMDVKFTSYMEEELDKIEEAHLDWVHVLAEFYEPFKKSLAKAQVDMARARSEPSEYSCPTCGRVMVYRFGKNGRFLSCSGYPECKAAMNVDVAGKPIPEIEAEHPCPECGRKLILRKSRLGPFLGCTGYPECTFTQPSDENGVPLKKIKPEDVKEQCPECGSPMAAKFARGRTFLGCTAYPKCKAVKPVPPGIHIEKPKPEDAGVHCDKCGRPMVIRKSRRGPFLSCSGFPRCRNAMPMEKLDHLKQLAEKGEIPPPPVESANGNGKAKRGRTSAKSRVKVDPSTLGNPPSGFAWTRTGRPVVETWPEETLHCPDCKREMLLKSGRFGPYYSCTGYPKCSFVANLRGDAKKRAEAEMPSPAKPKPVPTNVPCDECGEMMVIRTGRGGKFLGCGRYPKCRFSKPLPEGESEQTLAAAGV